jgi:ParB-like chromosome segregation protein Spo0J
MSTIKFAINNVLPNPFQTRQKDDPDHIRDLAISIAKHGILQPPTGRLSTTQPGKIEIAFGHSRLAALKLLNTADIECLEGLNIEIRTPEELQKFTNRFKEMEIEIKELSDLEMFEMAVTENNNRKDLNAIEEASAMVVYRDRFGKNSDEIGQLFNLSGAAVRNKMRLLDLPEKYISMVESGVITEGIAREILSVAELPESALSKFVEYDYRTQKNVTLLEYIDKEAAAGTIKLDSVREVINHLILRNSAELDKKPWKHAEQLHDIEAKPLPICKGCPKYLLRDKKEICMDPDCFKAKTIAWQTNYLLQASLLSGIPVLEHTDGEFKKHTSFGWSSTAALNQIRAKGGCENLRLVYEEPQKYRGDDTIKVTNMIEQGFPNAMIVCVKKEGFCTCIKAINAGIQSATENKEQLSEEQLKDLRKQLSEQKKNKKELIEGLVKQGALALQKGLKEKVLPTFKKIFISIPYNLSNNANYHKATTIEELTSITCSAIIQTQVYNDDPQSVLSNINRFLKDCGLDPLDIDLYTSNSVGVGESQQPVAEEGTSEEAGE